MAEYKINQQDKAFVEAFGLKPGAYKIYDPARTAVINSDMKLPVRIGANIALSQIYKPGVAVTVAANEDPFVGNNAEILQNIKSALGTLVLSQLKFADTTNLLLELNGKKGRVLEHKRPIDACLFSVNQTKNIIKTNIQGSNKGSIKEFINDGDYSINIKGIINGLNGVYPSYAVDDLIQYLIQPKELEIICPFLNELFGITYIVVENYSFPQNEGGYSYQVFEINAISEIPFTFKTL